MDSAAFTSLKKARPTGELHCPVCRKMKFPRRRILTHLLAEFPNKVAGVCPKCGTIMNAAIDATFHARLPLRMREKLRILPWTLEMYTLKYADHKEHITQRKKLKSAYIAILSEKIMPSDAIAQEDSVHLKLPEFLTEQQAEAYAQLRSGALKALRRHRSAPICHLVNGVYRYWKHDVDEWVAQSCKEVKY